MRKIAVGDLGEFWYGDYKEPFEQLEGGIPGYPRGVLLQDDGGKLLCAYCGKAYENLGRHAWATHGLRATDYKREVGLLQKSALASERVRQANISKGLRSRNLWPSVGRGMCRVEACDSPALARSLCTKHYTREYKKTRFESRRVRGQRGTEWYNKTGRCAVQVLAVARQIATEKGRLRYRDLAPHGIDARVVDRFYGSLESLAAQCGVPFGKPPVKEKPAPTQRLTNQQYLDLLRNLANEIGRTPTKSDLRRYGLPCLDTYWRHFGSYSAACRLAGLDPNTPFVPSDREVNFLTAYATVGSRKRAALVAGIHHETAARILAKYGFPFAPYDREHVAERKAWAAEMARRIAGWPDPASTAAA